MVFRESLRASAVRQIRIALFFYVLCAIFEWVPRLAIGYPFYLFSTLFFWVGYFLLTWGLMRLMASKARPRWWGFAGLLGPVGLLLFFVPRYEQ